MVDTTTNSRETAEDYEPLPDVGGSLAMDLAKGCSELTTARMGRPGMLVFSNPVLRCLRKDPLLRGRGHAGLDLFQIEKDDTIFSRRVLIIRT